MKIPTGSRVMAWSLFATSILLTAYAINKGLEGIASTVFVTGIPSAVGLYINKQWTELKTIKPTKNGSSE